MSNESNQPKSNKNFNRSLSGKGIILIMLIILVSIVFIGKIIAELRWNSYLAANQPNISFKEIMKDLNDFEKKNKDYPESLNLDETNWRWTINPSGHKPIVEATGISKTGNRRVSRFQYKNYEYLYANVGNNESGPMVVMWGVPVWQIESLGAYLEYTGHLEELGENIADWKKKKQTFFVILTPSKHYVWEGILPPQDKGTAGLERVLEPTPDWLKGNRLFENYAENF